MLQFVQRQLATSTHLALELLKNIQCSGGSRSFATETRDLKVRSMVAGHRKLTTTNWEQSLKLILLKLHVKFPKNSMLTILVIQCLKQIGMVKKLGKWVPHELTENQKKCHFEVLSSLILCNDSEPFLDWIVTCNQKKKKWILYDNQQWPAEWLDWEEAPKHFPKPNWHQKKKSHGHCLVVCCQSDPLKLSESQRNHYIWEVCSAHQQDASKLQCLWPTLLNRKGPVLLHDDTWTQIAQPTFQNWVNWAMKFCFLPSHSPALLPTDYHFFKHLDNFLQRKCLYNQ